MARATAVVDQTLSSAWKVMSSYPWRSTPDESRGSSWDAGGCALVSDLNFEQEKRSKSDTIILPRRRTVRLPYVQTAAERYEYNRGCAPWRNGIPCRKCDGAGLFQSYVGCNNPRCGDAPAKHRSRLEDFYRRDTVSKLKRFIENNFALSDTLSGEVALILYTMKECGEDPQDFSRLCSCVRRPSRALLKLGKTQGVM